METIMSYVIPPRMPYTQHEIFVPKADWPTAVDLLLRVRPLIASHKETYICIALGDVVGSYEERRVGRLLREMIEERLKPWYTYGQWVRHEDIGYWEDKEEIIVSGRLAWIDDLIEEFSCDS
jgi:hypothetical protein